MQEHYSSASHGCFLNHVSVTFIDKIYLSNPLKRGYNWRKTLYAMTPSHLGIEDSVWSLTYKFKTFILIRLLTIMYLGWSFLATRNLSHLSTYIFLLFFINSIFLFIFLFFHLCFTFSFIHLFVFILILLVIVSYYQKIKSLLSHYFIVVLLQKNSYLLIILHYFWTCYFQLLLYDYAIIFFQCNTAIFCCVFHLSLFCRMLSQ